MAVLEEHLVGKLFKSSANLSAPSSLNDYTRNQINWYSNQNNAPYAYGQKKEEKERTIVCRVAVNEEAMGVFAVVETVWAERILVGSVKDAS